MPLLQDQSVLVLGLGASGLAMARWCAQAGARVTVADTREAPPERVTLAAELPQVDFVAGPMDAALLERIAPRLVLKSPGLAPARVSALLEAATAAALPVTGELGLFAQALHTLREERGYAPAVLAITGTNGKTTVTSLCAQLVERAGKSVAMAGNIGPTLLDTLAARLAADDLPQVWVLELSSFQLADMAGGPAAQPFAGPPQERLHPLGGPGEARVGGHAWQLQATAATVLNITQDHLDWHGDMAAYAAAKARIFAEHTLMVLNRDDEAVMAMLPPPPAPSPTRSRTHAAAQAGGDAATTTPATPTPRGPKPQRPHLLFGQGQPTRPGDYGLETVNGMTWLVRAQEADPTWKPRKGQEADELHLQRLMPAEALRIRGRHNAVNALAALALAGAAGCGLASTLHGLREYRGEPHRVEPIAIVGEVEFFDDSKGTNVGATVAALAGLGAERHLVVILGGDGKGQDFSPLAAPVAQHARAAVLIGRDADAIRAALQGTGVELLAAQTLPEAVALAQQRARPGDAVLLSPACASFDMFDNYVHRAQVFRDAVATLAIEGGNTLEGSA